MRVVIFSLAIILLGSFAICEPIIKDATTSNDIDITIASLNVIFKEMNVNDQYKYELADDCYYMITKPADNKLSISFFMVSYDKGPTYKLAYESQYIYNLIAGSLVATECLEKDVVIDKYEINHECVSATMTAAKIIGLELEGTVDLEKFDSKNIEKCIASKLKPKQAATPYMNCLIKIIGNPDYAKKELAAILVTKRSLGYHCTENNNCFKHEDPQVLANIIKLEEGKADNVPIPFDSRKRLCQLRKEKITNFNVREKAGVKASHTYSCNFWVEEIYCDTSSRFLKWAVKYVNYNKDEDGSMSKVTEEMFYTSSFDTTAASVKKISVDWRKGVRMNEISFDRSTRTKAVFKLTAKLSDGTEQFCKHEAQATEANKAGTKLKEVKLTGELAGFEYMVNGYGVKVQSIFERT